MTSTIVLCILVRSSSPRIEVCRVREECNDGLFACRRFPCIQELDFLAIGSAVDPYSSKQLLVASDPGTHHHHPRWLEVIRGHANIIPSG